MKEVTRTKEEARRFLIQHALNEICEVSDFSKFHTRVFCVFAKLGLSLDAKKDNFLSGSEWSNLAQKDILIKRVEHFLIEHII